MQTNSVQKNHYNSLADLYSFHYGDRWSDIYRRIFFTPYLQPEKKPFRQRILVAMCGSGEGLQHFDQNEIYQICLDISEKEIINFHNKFAKSRALVGDIFDCCLKNETIDCTIIVGGLHHLNPNVIEGLSEILRILKPGGYLYFIEPHKGSLPDFIRKIWYRFDKYFASNEMSIDLELLKTSFETTFVFDFEKYGGNIAYLLCLNSMIFRMPKWIKNAISFTCISIEKILSPLMRPWNSCYVVCKWKKRFPKKC